MLTTGFVRCLARMLISCRLALAATAPSRLKAGVRPAGFWRQIQTRFLKIHIYRHVYWTHVIDNYIFVENSRKRTALPIRCFS